ncbi:MAG: DUF1700 domain-containing protein [Lachnospiraceae bacterium]
MKREEFIEKLRTALSGEVNYNLINDNVTYYEDYIAMEMQKGKTEEQVLQELGDPRLLAKTIIETNKIAGTNTTDAEYTEYDEDDITGKRKTKAFRMPGWMIGVIVAIIVILVFSMLTSVISFLLPVLLPFIAIVCVIRLIQRLR